MEKDNVVSFDTFRKMRFGESIKDDSLSAIFKKDLREQPELIQWYIFHNMVNKHKLFIHTLFLENHHQKSHNPNSGFVVCFQEDEMTYHKERILEAIQWEGREAVFVSAAGKSIREIGEAITGDTYRDNYRAAKAVEDILLNSNKVLVIQGISRMKASSDSKSGFARSLIKDLDDAHFKGIKPQSDLIFIDSAKFLQDSWANIGAYLNILS